MSDYAITFATVTVYFFFFNDTATTEIYTLSLHDALPISRRARPSRRWLRIGKFSSQGWARDENLRSEEHTSELQSQSNLVCRLLLEKKKKTKLLDTANFLRFRINTLNGSEVPNSALSMRP